MGLKVQIIAAAFALLAINSTNAKPSKKPIKPPGPPPPQKNKPKDKPEN